jgi:hypothetical protein
MSILNRQFPHLLPDDIAVWQAFLKQCPARWHVIDYDVRVGPGTDPGDSVSPKYRQVGLELSQMRIDAVGHLPNIIEIVEITTQAGLKAIGQLVSYPILFHHDFAPPKTVRPLLVCTSLKPGISTVLSELQIPHIIVNV